MLDIGDEPMTEPFIEVVEVGSGHRLARPACWLVTTIEVVSVANKSPGEGREKYVQQQREMTQARVNLVEIDLLRSGRRVFIVRDERIPASHRTAYQVCVWRASRAGKAEVYRAPLRERLPVIRVPLRSTDADATLALQDLLDQCWRNGAYDDIDYRVEPDPALDAEDRAWADALLRERGHR